LNNTSWNEKRIITIDLLGDDFLQAVNTGDPISFLHCLTDTLCIQLEISFLLQEASTTLEWFHLES